MNAPAATTKSFGLSKEALDFAPGLLAIQESPPARLPGALLYAVATLMALLLIWATFGHLDVVASADGKLVPQYYLKVVQPADAGIVTQILVHEGEHVLAGQVLLRMDAQDAQADARRVETDLMTRSLQLRRIDAELSGRPLHRLPTDTPEAFLQAQAQYHDRRQSYLDSLGQGQQQLSKAEQDLNSARSVLTKLRQTNPILKSQAESYAGLGKDGYVPKVTVGEKQRAYIENEQDLAAQESTVMGLSAAVLEAQQRLSELGAKYRSDLQNERVEADSEYRKLQQDWAKQAHRASLLELKAPETGIIKDLAAHTIGTVVSTGTVLLSIVPDREPLVAEVMIRNDDVGFVHTHQKVKVKLAAYPFQKYGMLDGEVLQVWPDASDESSVSGQNSRIGGTNATSTTTPSYGFKARVALDHQVLVNAGESLSLVAGMQVIAEVREGRRTVMEYLLSPLKGAMHDGGRER